MKKFLFSAAAFVAASSAFAGGYLTNTNQSAAYLRNPAQLATFDITGAYTNPAGLAWLGNGWHLAFNIQNAAQTRTILSTYAPFAYNSTQLGNINREFEGEATAPFIPSLDVAYQKGKWTASMHFGITGGGGKATFNNGLPMFESQVAYAHAAATQVINGFNELANKFNPILIGQGAHLPLLTPSNGYTLETYMKGRQYLFGLQMGLTYKIFDNLGDHKQGLSAYVGARMNFASNAYEGYMRNTNVNMPDNSQIPLPEYMKYAAANGENAASFANAMASQLPTLGPSIGLTPEQAQQTAAMLKEKAAQLQGAADALNAGATRLGRDIALDCNQKGWGIAPILGLDYRIGDLNIGMRYEFNTELNIENNTKLNTTGNASFADGVNTPNDVPSLLAIGAQYSILDKVRVMAGWNCYFDKNANMAGGKEKFIKHNTHEITIGAEYDILDRLTISGGFQNTDYGTTPDFQSDLSFHCDSYSLGFGAKMKVNDKVNVEASYFWTNYKDFTKEQASYNGTGIAGKDVYSRTNRAFGLGITYDF